MRFNLTTMTALAGSLVLTASVASAAPSLNFKLSPDMNSNLVDLARQRGGGGGGGGDGGGGRGGRGGGGDGGGGAMLRGGGDGGGPGMRRGGGGDGPGVRSGRYAGDDGPRVRSGGRYADDGGPRVRRGPDFDKGDWNHRDKRHHAGRDHDRDGKKFERHRVWRNGAWVWVYGPDIYAYGDDCWWLLRRAEMTGSPYWWRRYEECVY